MRATEAATPELTAAAQALDEELRRYEQLAAALEREQLGSEKSLRRAAETLSALRESDARLSERRHALMAAITRAGQRQQTQEASVQARAEQVRQRIEVLAGLLGRWEAMGAGAAELNQLLQQLHERKDEGNGGGHPGGPATLFENADVRLCGLIEEAEGLGREADREQFADLGRQAEGLRAQLLAARNKLQLLRARLAGPRAPD